MLPIRTMVSPLEKSACQHNSQKANPGRGSHNIMREAQNHTAARCNEKRKGQSLEKGPLEESAGSIIFFFARLRVTKLHHFREGGMASSLSCRVRTGGMVCSTVSSCSTAANAK